MSMAKEKVIVIEKGGGCSGMIGGCFGMLLFLTLLGVGVFWLAGRAERALPSASQSASE